MKILLHTIALEPARWTPQRVSCRLTDLLPAIAEEGFRELEVYEPHLTAADVSEEIKSAFLAQQLSPVILSSYLNLDPAETSNAQLQKKLELLARRLRFYGFRKLRLFPGPGISATDKAAIVAFRRRLRRIAEYLSETELLLETHDGSLADDPALLARIVGDLALPNVGLLYQPTVFEPAPALEQFRLQKNLIRHLHLQNRNADLTFAKLRDGVIPWPEIVSEIDSAVEATLEFVPAGICQVADFDLARTLREAREEADYAGAMLSA